MSVALVVPYRADGDPSRARAWAWVRARYGELHADWPVVVCEPDGEPWRKGEAVARGLAATDADVVLVADADSFCPAESLHTAVRLVLDGAPWVMPHSHVWRIRVGQTDRILRRPPIDRPHAGYLSREQPVAPIGGGIVCARRDALLDVPLDPRFEGWGGEDIAWGWALDTLLGAHATADGHLYHLWHTAQPTRRKALSSTEILAGRYGNANGDAAAMRAIMAEAL